MFAPVAPRLEAERVLVDQILHDLPERLGQFVAPVRERHAAAYQGPNQALVDTYLELMK